MTSKIGISAFPQFVLSNGGAYVEGGMTLRDYFASMAMQGDMTQGIHQSDFRITAERAYLMADAMLEERK